MPPTRKSAFVEVRVYEPGHGTPWALDYGFGAYDVLEKSWKRGTPDRMSDRQSTTQWIAGIGLVNRVRLVPQDTRLAHFTYSPATWEETLPVGGAYRVWRLTQYDTAAGVDYHAQSIYALTEDPEVAFSLGLEDTPPDWDEENFPPFVRAEFGGLWGVELRKAGAALVKWDGSHWNPVMDLSAPGRGTGYADLAESWFYVRCLEGTGKIAVSSDYGVSYQVYEDPAGAIAVPAARWRIAGRGGVLLVGMHQLLPVTATYRNGGWPTLETRGAVTATLSGRFTGDVALSDVGSGPGQRSQYQAVLTPRSQACTPFTVWHSAALRAVSYRYVQSITSLGDTYTTPWTNHLLRVHISKPGELDGGSATITLRHSAFEAFDLEDPGWRFRLIKIVAGYNLSDGTRETTVSFTGYVRKVDLNWVDFGSAEVTLQLDNASFRYRRSPWGPLEVYPFGGMTINGAANLILQTRGLDASYAAWHALGGLRTLGQGTPEEPFEQTRPNELPWETLKRLMGYECLEPVPLDDGTFTSVVKDALETEVAHRYTPRSDADLRQMLRTVRHGVDYSQSATAVIVWGETDEGAIAILAGRDVEAETDPTCGRFSLWRDQVIEQVSGRPDRATLLSRADALARTYLPLKYEAAVEAPLHVGLSRRQRVAIHHCEGIGIPDGTEYGVMSLEHDIPAGEGLTSITTSAGLRRIGRLSA